MIKSVDKRFKFCTVLADCSRGCPWLTISDPARVSQEHYVYASRTLMAYGS